jgi:anti-sigma regulatory factor (Ser/Thr protein kinase)
VACRLHHRRVRQRSLSAEEAVASTELSLPSDPIAPALARAGVRSLTHDLPFAVAADLALLVTEVVSNAVRHSGMAPTDDILVRLSTNRTVRVEVLDQGPGFAALETRARPATRETRGWGLFLVDRLADAWGVDREPSGTTVWFELETDRSPG